MAAPHIMLAYSLYPPIQAGGAELIVSYLAEGLVRRGARVTVVTTCGPDMQPEPGETRNGVEIVRFFPPNRYWLFQRSGRSAVDKALFHLKDAWNRDCGPILAAIMAQKRPDLLHTHCIEGFSPTVWRAANEQGIPVVHTAHDYHLMCPRAYRVTRQLEVCVQPRLVCRAMARWNMHWTGLVQRFCSPSRFLLEQHLQAGLPATKGAVVRNGIPVPMRSLDPQKGAGDRPLRLLFAARLTREKGVAVVLDAMQRLPADLEVELVIAGKGDLEEEVTQAAQRDHRIRYAGYLSGEAKHEAFSWADAVLLPSLWYENAPVVIVEAAAYGLGIIGSDLGAIPEFVEPGRNGVLFPPGDAGALADIIAQLAADRAPVAAWREKGADVVQDYTVERMVDAYLDQYQPLLA